MLSLEAHERPDAFEIVLRLENFIESENLNFIDIGIDTNLIYPFIKD